ncbi:MAG: hypothetical protein OXF08_04860 [Bacteroidetes bacterium]|nr:hypothetical protein [Bacteroidota bacterium]
MDSLVERLKKGVEAEATIVTRLYKDGCSLSKKGLPKENIVIDLDKIHSILQEKRADYLFASDDWILAIEMKKNRPNIKFSAQQLQATAKMIENLTHGVKVENFRPVLASGSLHKKQKLRLSNHSNHIQFRGKPYRIEVIKCGSQLRQILS